MVDHSTQASEWCQRPIQHSHNLPSTITALHLYTLRLHNSTTPYPSISSYFIPTMDPPNNKRKTPSAHHEGRNINSETSAKKQKKEVEELDKIDPLALLSDELCLEIFSFLCPKPKIHQPTGMTSFQWLQSDVGPFCIQLRSVSNAWKTAFDRIDLADWVGVVDVELHLAKCKASLIGWLCQHGVRLGRVTCRQGINTEEIELVSKLITECPTDGLLMLDVASHMQPVPANADKDYSLDRMTDNAKNQSFHMNTENNLHGLIAKECPNLTCLSVSLRLPKNAPLCAPHISKDLFSISAIQCLHIKIGFHQSLGLVSVDGRLFSDFIKNLPNLQSLDLATISGEGDLGSSNICRRFHIESPSLRELDVIGLWEDTAISLDCPALENFSCHGGRNGNGWMHNGLERQRFLSILDDASSLTAFSIRTEARCMALNGSRVPPTCGITLTNFQQWRGRNFEEYAKRVVTFANAVYETFEGKGMVHV